MTSLEAEITSQAAASGVGDRYAAPERSSAHAPIHPSTACGWQWLNDRRAFAGARSPVGCVLTQQLANVPAMLLGQPVCVLVAVQQLRQIRSEDGGWHRFQDDDRCAAAAGAAPVASARHPPGDSQLTGRITSTRSTPSTKGTSTLPASRQSTAAAPWRCGINCW